MDFSFTIVGSVVLYTTGYLLDHLSDVISSCRRVTVTSLNMNYTVVEHCGSRIICCTALFYGIPMRFRSRITPCTFILNLPMINADHLLWFHFESLVRCRLWYGYLSDWIVTMVLISAKNYSLLDLLAKRFQNIQLTMTHQPLTALNWW